MAKVNFSEMLGGERYRTLIVSVAAFLALVLVLLAFTFYASGILARNSVLMNETNRVSNAAQVIIKDLFDLENSWGEDVGTPHMQRVLGRLKQNSELMTTHLALMEKGGEITDESGESFVLPATSSKVGKESLAQAQAEWALLQPKLADYLKDSSNLMVDSSDELTQAVNQAKTSSLRIDESLGRLVADTTRSTNRQAAIIRAIQLVGVLAVLAYFLVFITVLVGRLRRVDTRLDQARKETQEIMATVNTGLFLLDKDLTIGNQYSNALVDIIGADKLAGERLSSVLKNRISDRDLKIAEEFVEQLYNPRVKEKLVDDLNPLRKVLLHDNILTGESRYLDFKFYRVYDNKEIVRILVNVDDVSEAVKLEQRLEKERAENDLQIEMLTTIVSSNPKMIGDFINGVYTRIDKMNAVLKNQGSSQFELENKLKAIYREMHSLKGEASALKLHSFTKIASEAEDKLHALQNQDRLSGNDFLSLAVHLDELLNLSQAISGLGQRLNEASNQIGSQLAHRTNPNLNPLPSADSQAPARQSIADKLVARPDAKAELGDYLEQFGRDIAIRQGKAVDIDVSQMAGQHIPEELSDVVREICVQLIRNSIVHGIADNDTRVSRGKAYRGKVTVALKEGDPNNCFMFSVEDDGQGIDYDNIRQTLVKKRTHTVEQANALSEPQLLNALFSSGFSTRDYADEDGGRGVGLDLVKERVKAFGGKVSVQSEKGRFTRLIIKLPMPNTN